MTTIVLTIVGPAEATVRFDGAAPTAVSSSRSFDKVASGNHTFIIEAPGFLPATLTLTTSGEAVVPLKAGLKHVPGKLTITSDPSGATLVLDGVAKDKKTPASFELDDNSVHEIRVELENYKAVVRPEVRVARSAEHIERIKLLPSMVHLLVITTPEGAKLKVGGVDMGVTPVVIDRLPDDPYTEVELTKPGCVPRKTTVPFDREKAEDRWEAKLKCR